MKAAQGISKYGFRSWYERELIVCHSYLVTCLLSMVLALVLMEHIDLRSISAWSVGAIVLIVFATAGCRCWLRVAPSMMPSRCGCACNADIVGISGRLSQHFNKIK